MAKYEISIDLSDEDLTAIQAAMLESGTPEGSETEYLLSVLRGAIDSWKGYYVHNRSELERLRAANASMALQLETYGKIAK